MAYPLHNPAEAPAGGIDPARLSNAVDRLIAIDRPRYARLWAYIRNPMRAGILPSEPGTADRPYRQAQEWGLPARITGFRPGGELLAPEQLDAIARKEVVIENDIGWRIETMVDYLFGKPVVIRSAARDPQRRSVLDRLIRAILAQNGGLLFLQQMALLGSVYGFVDVLVKLDPEALAAFQIRNDEPETPAACGRQDLGEPPAGCDSGDNSGHLGGMSGGAPAPAADEVPPADGESPAPGAQEDPASTPLADTGATDESLEALIQRIARLVRLEVVEPARAVPLLSPTDYRCVEAYGQCYELEAASRRRFSAPGGGSPVRRWWERLWQSRDGESPQPPTTRVLELIWPTRWQRYEDEKLVAEGANALEEIPLVHIQNTAVPFEYAGASDVEPLIPLQDELNTRLSDRAHRITMQSFKMYLGKGIENFIDLPVAPGRMWSSDNDEADVIEFGGDADCPSENNHIADVREAMDKTSGVSPIAAGAIKNRIGRLTSAAALRITLISLLARTDKKRTTYGGGVQRMIALALAWLDRLGIFATDPEERGIELHWPSPLPENQVEKLQEAEIKARLGVPRQVVLRELGY